MSNRFVKFNRPCNLKCLKKQQRPVVHLREFSLNDADQIYKWRNHPSVREHFIDPKPISLTDHLLWCNNVLQNNAVIFLVAEDDKGQLVGTIRYDIDIPDAYLSIYVNPERFGQGLGSAIILRAINFIQKLDKIDTLVALVKDTNNASKQLFKTCGFNEEKEVVYL